MRLSNKLINIIIILSFFLFLPVKTSATVITVNPGESIQTKCLNEGKIKPGDSCTINPGTYNESLTLTVSGTSSSPITIKCITSKNCTINSGSSKTISTKGQVNYYIIDGLRLISASGGGQSSSSLNFDSGKWISISDKTSGVAGHILRNCYAEGSVYFFGHHNLVENCEFNGKNIWTTGITEKFGPSHDNVFRNNFIHDYKGRGIWSMQYTDNTLIENNTITDTGLMGIDCDGAGNRIDHCLVRNNKISHISGEGVGILMENTFNSVVEGNTVTDSVSGISTIHYGKTGNWDANFHADNEYRNLPSNLLISNNVIDNTSSNGIMCNSSSDVTVTGNTISRTNTNGRGYFAAIGLGRNGDYYCRNWTIRNNYLSQTQYAYWFESGTYTIYSGTYEGLNINVPTDLGRLIIENNRYDYSDTAMKYHYKISASRSDITSEYNRSFEQMRQAGYESGSITSFIPKATAGTVMADANSDGRVDGADYIIWLNHYGQTTGNKQADGDFDGSGTVNGTDYIIWLNRYGQ